MIRSPEVFSEFRAIAESSVGIAQLRLLVLRLAVQGKLVPQDPEAPPGRNLLADAEAELSRLRRQGELPTTREESNEAASGALPRGWAWTTLDCVAAILDHRRVPINTAERERRIEGKGRDSLYPYYGATQQVGWIDGYLFDEELVLLGEDGVQFFDPLKPKAYIVSPS